MEQALEIERKEEARRAREEERVADKKRREEEDNKDRHSLKEKEEEARGGRGWASSHQEGGRRDVFEEVALSRADALLKQGRRNRSRSPPSEKQETAKSSDEDRVKSDEDVEEDEEDEESKRRHLAQEEELKALQEEAKALKKALRDMDVMTGSMSGVTCSSLLDENESLEAELKRLKEAIREMAQQEATALPKLPPARRASIDDTPSIRTSSASTSKASSGEEPELALLLEEWPEGGLRPEEVKEEAKERWVQYVGLQEHMSHLRKTHVLEERDWRKNLPKMERGLPSNRFQGPARRRIHALEDAYASTAIRLVRGSLWEETRAYGKMGVFEQDWWGYTGQSGLSGRKRRGSVTEMGEEGLLVLADLSRAAEVSIQERVGLLKRTWEEAEAYEALNVAHGVHVVVDLEENELGGLLARALKGLIAAPVELYLGENGLLSSDMTGLKPLLEDKGLKCIDLSRNELNCKGGEALCRLFVPQTSLQHLSLRDNNLLEVGALALSESLTGGGLDKLLSLNLRMNTIGDRGMAAICKAVESHGSLEALDLRENGISQSSASACASLLRGNNILHTLWLCRNDWTDEGACTIGDALESNRGLGSLLLTTSKIGNIGAQGLLKAMKTNTTLLELDLRENPVHSSKLQVISDKIEANIARAEKGRLPLRLKRSKGGSGGNMEALAAQMARQSIAAERRDEVEAEKSEAVKAHEEYQKKRAVAKPRKPLNEDVMLRRLEGTKYAPKGKLR